MDRWQTVEYWGRQDQKRRNEKTLEEGRSIVCKDHAHCSNAKRKETVGEGTQDFIEFI